MNEKEQKIIKLKDKGLSAKRIAQKLGYSGGNLCKGIELVVEVIKKYG